MLVRTWRNGNPYTSLVGIYRWMWPIWKTVWEFLRKLKIQRPDDSAVLLLGIRWLSSSALGYISKKHKTKNLKRHYLKLQKAWKPPQCPWTDACRKKMWCTHTVEYYSVVKKKEALPFAVAWMGLAGIMRGKLRQMEKDKCCVTLLMHGIQKLQQTSDYNIKEANS